MALFGIIQSNKLDDLKTSLARRPWLVEEPIIPRNNIYPLHLATISARFEMMRVLVAAKKQSIDVRTKNGSTSVHLAIRSGCRSLSDRVRSELVELLFKMGSRSLDLQDFDGNTPMHLAAMTGNVHVIRLLSVQGSKAYLIANKKGQTPMHLAAKHSQSEAVRALYECAGNKAAFSVQDAKGRTPFFLAATRDRSILETIVNIVGLRYSGISDYKNRFPYTAALNKNLSHCAAFLAENGAPYDRDLLTERGHITMAFVVAHLIQVERQINRRTFVHRD